MGGKMTTRDYKSKFHFGDPELPYKHHSAVLRRSKRERCENCGRFVTDQQLWHSKELGHSVCDHCHDPQRDGNMGTNWLTDYVDYFEDIQNGGLETYYD